MYEKTVTITTEEYLELQRKAMLFDMLESAGVDNWSGYDLAMEYIEE